MLKLIHKVVIIWNIQIITTKDNKNIRENRTVNIDDFLVMKDENAYDKYKDVLSKIIEVTKQVVISFCF